MSNELLKRIAMHLDFAQRELDKLRAQIDQGEIDTADDDWTDTRTAAEMLGVSDSLLRDWAREKGIGRKPGTRWEISLSRARERLGR